MPVTCSCPRSAALETIPNADCPVNFGQTQKAIFVRKFKDDGTENSITVENSKLKASWIALMTAEDGTKVIISPYLQAPTNEAGAPITFGGGNDTPGGIAIVMGTEPSVFNAVIRQTPQTVIAAMKALQCEDLGVYLINENGQIAGKKVGENLLPFPIAQGTFNVTDLILGGKDTPDGNNVTWSFIAGWSDGFEMITPTDFNALQLRLPANPA